MTRKLHHLLAAALAAAVCTVAAPPLQAQEESGNDIVNTYSTNWFGPETLLPDAVQNGNFTDNSGWEGIGTANFGTVEFYQTGFDMSQKITGLEPGYYVVKANAFQRVAANDGGAAFEAGTETITARLYAKSGELEMGQYFCSLYASNLYEGRYANNMNEAAYAFAEGDYEISTYPIQVGEDGTLTIGASENTLTTSSRWCILSNVRLYKVELLPSTGAIEDYMAQAGPHSTTAEMALNEAIAALQAAVAEGAEETVLIDRADAVNATLLTFKSSEDEYADYIEDLTLLREKTAQFADLPGYQALLTKIDETEAAYESNTDDIETLLDELQAALQACILSGTDYTMLIENPSFEEYSFDRAAVIPGWTKNGTENSEFCTRNDEGGRIPAYGEGSVYFQHWAPGNLPDFSVTQTLTEIPNGKYRVTAAGAFAGEGYYLTAGDNKTAIDSTGDFTVETLVTDNSLTFGVKTQGATGNWVRADNFRLTYLGDLNPAPAEPSAAIDESGTYYIYHPAADKFMANNDAATNGALYTMGSIEDEDAYKWEITLAPGADESAPDTVSLKQLSSGKYLNALGTNAWSMGLGDYDATGSRYIVNAAEGTYTLSNLRNTSAMIGFDNLNNGSTPYYDKGTGNNPYLKFYKVDEYEEYLPQIAYYQQKETLRERINTMKDLQDGILGGYHSQEDEEGLASILAYALEIYEQTADVVALDSLTAAVGIADDAIEVYRYSTMATEDNPANFSFAIANADGEQCSWHNIPGWTMDPASIGNWGGKAVDNDVLTGQSIELWNPSGSPFTVSLTQSLAGLPDGKYSLTVGAFAADQANGTNTGALYFFAGNRKADIQVSNPAGTDEEVVGAAELYSIGDIYVSGGTLELGIRAEASNANWFGFDNVTLTYYGPKETLLVLTDSVTRTTDMGYTPTFIDNRSAEICDFLMVDSLTEESVTIFGVNANDSLLAETAAYDGWRDAEGNFCNWGQGSEICVKFPDQGDGSNQISICNMPDSAEAGDQYVTRWMAATATDTVIIRTVITMEAPEIPDITSPEQCTNLETIQLSAEVDAPQSNYEVEQLAVDVEAIAALFGTDAETFSQTVRFCALDAEGLFAAQSTANSGGYWFDAEGTVCTWGDNARFFVEPAEPQNYSTLNAGQMPGTCAAGDEFQTTLYFVIGNEMVTLEVTYTIADDPTGIEETTAEAEVIATEYYTLDGIRIDSPAQGTYVEKVTYSDGNVKSQVIIRE